MHWARRSVVMAHDKLNEHGSHDDFPLLLNLSISYEKLPEEELYSEGLKNWPSLRKKK